jgi:hypothetical protein
VAPGFNLTTGKGAISVRTSVAGCGPTGFSNDGAALGMNGVDSNIITSTTTAPRTFLVNYTFNLSYNLTASLANPAGGPYAWASFEVQFWGILWNLSTSKPVSTIGLLFGLSTNGSKTPTLTGTWGSNSTISIFGFSLNTHDKYVVEVYYSVQVNAHAPAGTMTHASAKVVMAGSTHGYRLRHWALI